MLTAVLTLYKIAIPVFNGKPYISIHHRSKTIIIILISRDGSSASPITRSYSTVCCTGLTGQRGELLTILRHFYVHILTTFSHSQNEATQKGI